LNRGTVGSWLYHGKKPSRITRKRDFKEIPDSARELTGEKGYILGVVGPGDGHVHRKYLKLNTTNRDFAEKFKACLEGVFGFDVGIKKRKDVLEVTLSSLEASREILRYAPLEHFRHHTERVPEGIKKAPNPVKSSYLQGFFDSQGEADAQDNCISAQKANRAVLEEIKILLSDFGINATIYKGSKQVQGYRMWELSIPDKKGIRIYADEVGFSIRQKTERLNKVLRHFKKTENFWKCPICGSEVKRRGRYVHFRNVHPDLDYYDYRFDFEEVPRGKSSNKSDYPAI